MEAYQRITEKKRMHIFINIVISCIACSMLSTALNTALPPIIEDIHVSVTTGQWLASGYSLTMAIIMPLTAFLINRFPTRKLYCTAILIFLAGLLISGVSVNFPMMMLGQLWPPSVSVLGSMLLYFIMMGGSTVYFFHQAFNQFRLQKVMSSRFSGGNLNSNLSLKYHSQSFKNLYQRLAGDFLCKINLCFSHSTPSKDETTATKAKKEKQVNHTEEEIELLSTRLEEMETLLSQKSFTAEEIVTAYLNLLSAVNQVSY